ncbi:mannosyltransferase [Saitoella coloradoensis]
MFKRRTSNTDLLATGSWQARQRDTTGARVSRESKRALFKYLLLAVLAASLVYNYVGWSRGRSAGPAATAKTWSYEIVKPEPINQWDNTQKQTLGKEKAALVMLVRNKEINDALHSIRAIEDRFNRNYHYPWVFMNDEPFTESFMKLTSGLASGPVEYAQIPKEHWSVPDWLDVPKAQKSMEDMVAKGIIYGGSVSYRHMCRFNSAFFFRQEVLAKYDWYWRVEPSVDFYCDVDYDPFAFMRENKKTYGFVMSLYEYEATIPTLWKATADFIKDHPDYLASNNSLDFLIDGQAPSAEGDKSIPEKGYNLCHFWSNFEIADLNFWRSKTYLDYVDYLDNLGGFFYERWGDAPVHSLAVSLFLPKDKVHHFSDISYRHAPYTRCPQDEESYANGRCVCPIPKTQNFDTDGYSCLPRWWAVAGKGPGC